MLRRERSADVKKKVDGMLAGFGIPHGIPPNEWYLSELTNLTRPTS